MSRVALVIGASGITGINLIQHIVKDPSWSKVYGVARRELPAHTVKSDKIAFVQCDVADENDCREKLGACTDVTHVFFVAWVKRATEEEMVVINGQMIKNVLKTVDSCAKDLKHVILQTGTKYYGCHLAPFKTPAKEDQARHEGPNFYYVQEDFLTQFCQQQGNKWAWNIFRPHDIIGFTTLNLMNLGTTLAVYASLCRELKIPFAFPGDPAVWNAKMDASDVDLLCRMMLWACDTPKAHNQAFNAVNGDFFTYKELWPKLAEYFGLEAPAEPKPVKVEEQMKQLNAEQVWRDLAKKHNLKIDNLNELVTWWFMDAVLGAWKWDNCSSMDKAREFGFNDKVDTTEMYKSLFDKLEKDNIIPPTKL